MTRDIVGISTWAIYSMGRGLASSILFALRMLPFTAGQPKTEDEDRPSQKCCDESIRKLLSRWFWMSIYTTNNVYSMLFGICESDGSVIFKTDFLKSITSHLWCHDEVIRLGTMPPCDLRWDFSRRICHAVAPVGHLDREMSAKHFWFKNPTSKKNSQFVYQKFQMTHILHDHN